MSDKIDIVIGMLERFENNTNRQIDDLRKDMVKFQMDLKEFEFIHENCPGELALEQISVINKQTQTVRFFSDKPKMFLYMIVGFLTIGVVSAIISWGTVKYVRTDDKKAAVTIQLEPKTN